MKHHRDPMANVLRRTWTEPIDGVTYAAIAEFSETWHGMMFAASTFILLAHHEWRHYRSGERAIAKLEDELRRGDHLIKAHGGGHYQGRFGMPCVGSIRDLNRPYPPCNHPPCPKRCNYTRSPTVSNPPLF